MFPPIFVLGPIVTFLPLTSPITSIFSKNISPVANTLPQISDVLRLLLDLRTPFFFVYEDIFSNQIIIYNNFSLNLYGCL